ncbi:MAG: acetyl-CoA carboxylase carboxyltransferase subunit beta [Candidatus Aminicenantes bacterium]|nr:acetyl-CoA carboxylase carboxyltransferase subunit beta [Candidatus Aminicenantes bacterium]
MAWFKKTETENRISGELKLDIWTRCPSCESHIYKEEWHNNLNVCPKCNYHDRISCIQRLNLLVDKNTYVELNPDITPIDILHFKDGKGNYKDKIKETIRKTNLNESVITGYGQMNGKKVAIAIMDFRFLGGSLGSGTGQKIFMAANYAVEHHLPYIVISASGGARMQEGMLSLMQMAKTCAGIAQLKKKNLPYISILTDPTSGGVSASYAMIGDVNMAEPGALIAFAGRRVIEQTIKQKLPDNFQTAEYLREHGFIDMIINRKDMKKRICEILEFYQR